MNSQHRIDRAEFDTTYADARVTRNQQAGLDEFIKSELMRVVDEVFDDIERKSGGLAAGLRMERIEIDLGEISYRDYRQQMPQRLRRQLWQALDNARYTAAAKHSTLSGQDKASGNAKPVLFYLRYGYLPWYASVADTSALEAQLLQVIETSPASLVDFIGGAARVDEIIARLNAQFPVSLVDRVMQLLESPQNTAVAVGDTAAEILDQQPNARTGAASKIEQRRAQLQAVLSSGEQAEFERLWQNLMQNESDALLEVLRDIGQQALRRQQIVQRLTAPQFIELVRLLEPTAHDMVLSVFEQGHWLSGFGGQSALGAAAGTTRLHEYLLGYLLVERGPRFDRNAFVESLLKQISVSDRGPRSREWSSFEDKLEAAAQADGVSGELARSMLTQAEGLAGNPTTDWRDAYRRYNRVEAAISTASTRPVEALLLADIDALAQLSPWLLLRLLRELQTDDDRRSALRLLSAPVLATLSYNFLSLINQTVATKASAGAADLVAAIRRNVEHAPSPQAYYADILSRLIDGDVIDFDAIGVVESAGMSQDGSVGRVAIADKVTEPAADRETSIDSLSPMGASAVQLLQFAELLATASLAAGLTLSPRQLQAIQWRFVKSYTTETGNLFNRDRFLRGYLEILIDRGGVSDTGRFYSLLGQALLRNSLPATRDLTRQIIELLDDIAAESAPVVEANRIDSRPAETASREAGFDEISPDEDIHIANAGLVLLAPWLPRLFEHLDFIEDGEFKDHDTAERAVHCLQYLVNASVASPEYQLVLNKLLCGVRPGKPIRRQIDLSVAETEQLESLLMAVTEHWKALENTSTDGLRESFLQRGGRLQRKGDAWQLAVEARAFDMLLDQVPWSYSTIKFGWMDRVIYVDWR